jgi:hypothetical protein
MSAAASYPLPLTISSRSFLPLLTI